jgi:Flp pilus assembly protein TadG
MTSAIITDSIDVEFPVAEQDNDSQGFRDNFSSISNALDTAASEITALQLTTAKLDQNNDFGGNVLINAVTRRVYNSDYSFTGSTVNVTDGDYQIVNLTSNALSITGWPELIDGGCVKVRLLLKSGGTSKSVTVTSANSEFVKTNFDNLLVIPANKEAVIEVWSSDIGVNVYVHNLGIFQ